MNSHLTTFQNYALALTKDVRTMPLRARQAEAAARLKGEPTLSRPPHGKMSREESRAEFQKLLVPFGASGAFLAAALKFAPLLVESHLVPALAVTAVIGATAKIGRDAASLVLNDSPVFPSVAALAGTKNTDEAPKFPGISITSFNPNTKSRITIENVGRLESGYLAHVMRQEDERQAELEKAIKQKKPASAPTASAKPNAAPASPAKLEALEGGKNKLAPAPSKPRGPNEPPLGPRLVK